LLAVRAISERRFGAAEDPADCAAGRTQIIQFWRRLFCLGSTDRLKLLTSVTETVNQARVALQEGREATFVLRVKNDNTPIDP
jgi:hypothetical protein